MVTAVGHFEKMHHPVLAPAVAYLLAKLLLCAPHVCECVYILDFVMRLGFGLSHDLTNIFNFKELQCARVRASDVREKKVANIARLLCATHRRRCRCCF